MTKTFEICFEDLTPEAQQRYKDIVGDEINEFMPIAVLEYDVEDVTDIPLIALEDMDMTNRSYNCLKSVEIDTLRDIIEFDMNQQNPPSRGHNWLTIRNLGKKSLMEIAKKVFDYCNYRIQYFYDDKYQGYIPLFEGEEKCNAENHK